MDFQKRLENLRAAMADERMDSIVYGTGASFQYFTGLLVPWHRMKEPAVPTCFLLVSPRKDPVVLLDKKWAHLAKLSPVDSIVVESADQVLAVFQDRLSGDAVGTSRAAQNYVTGLVHKAMPKTRCLNADGLGDKMRMIKEPKEVAILRRAAAMAGDTLAKVVPSITPGVTQIQLQNMVARTGKSLGAEDVSFSPAALFVKSGTQPSEDPFVYPAEADLVPGTSVAFDYGFLIDGYCSDFGRSFYCGPAPKDFVKAYNALQTAQTELVAELKPHDTNMGDMFRMLESVMDRLGYGDRLRARLPDGTLGHQIGVDVHENPWIRPSTDMILRPGMVMAIEPKVWLPGEYYLRVEDIVLITEDGAHFLTEFDRELFELAT